MPRKIRDSVVVITGAASGIGRATALEFARKGATVVVAARREQALQELVSECEQAGGRALVVPTDVSNQEAVNTLARRAVETFGRIDVWVNNAALSLFGRFEETPIEDYKRVLEVNILGYVYGARAALPVFREQGSGVLIQVSSIVALATQPYTSPYVMSKAAVRTMSMSLRQELLLDGNHDIHVCTVLPATIDTPFFQHAANYTGRATKAMPPVYPATRVAKTIVGLAKNPKREVMVGNAGRMLGMIRTIAPGLAERMMAQQVDKTHLYRDKWQEPTSGNLWEPMPQYDQVSGNWTSGGVQPEEAAPQRAMGLIVAAAAGLAFFFWQRQRQPQTLREQVLEQGSTAIGSAGKLLQFRRRQRQPQTLSEQLLEQGSNTLGAAGKLFSFQKQNGIIARGMDTLSAASDLLPGQKRSRWSRITARVLG